MTSMWFHEPAAANCKNNVTMNYIPKLCPKIPCPNEWMRTCALLNESPVPYSGFTTMIHVRYKFLLGVKLESMIGLVWGVSQYKDFDWLAGDIDYDAATILSFTWVGDSINLSDMAWLAASGAFPWRSFCK